jgi:anti-sigma regulatory factor (Ser/Thr protein kinase)
MSDGDTLVLYTDGLTERRSEPIEAGLQRMLAALGEAADLEPEGICDLLLRTVAPSGSRSDDVAMLCARFHAGVSFTASFPARPEVLAEMRRTVSGWLIGTAADAQLRDDIVLAVNEACANAVEHARPRGGAGDVRIEAFAGDDLVFRVVDGGMWREASADPMRGRGLELIRSLVDDLVIDRSDEGTTLHLRWSHRRIGGAPWIST